MHQRELSSEPTIQQQAAKLLSQVAGYVGVRVMDIGLRLGLLEEISRHPQGIAAEALAHQCGLDPFYVQVWGRAAYAAELLEIGEAQSYRLAPFVDRLLLDKDFPGYIGGVATVITFPEIFDQFAEKLPSGERVWWDQHSPTFIQAVADTGRSFYTRIITAGFSRVPRLVEQLNSGARVLELGCGLGIGLTRIAQAYPSVTVVGVDGDAYSLQLAADNLRQAGVQDRVSLIDSTFEAIEASEEYDVSLINISMHECRDIDRVTANVHRALKPGGYFVISDFPFPDSVEACRTVPARIMCGVQFSEALKGDQLLSTTAFENLLKRHGFRDVASFELAPVHVVIYGQK